MRAEPLGVEFTKKIRDTLAASVWAQGRVPEAAEIVRYLKGAWRGEKGKVHVALWQEGLDHAEAVAVDELVRNQLRWLNPKVRIANTDLIARSPAAGIEGLSVRTSARRN